MRPVTYGWLALGLGVACAAINWLGLAGWLAVVVLGASIAMHVAGNALGTSLRDAADRRLERPAGKPKVDLPTPAPTHLERRTSLGLPFEECQGHLRRHRWVRRACRVDGRLAPRGCLGRDLLGGARESVRVFGGQLHRDRPHQPAGGSGSRARHLNGGRANRPWKPGEGRGTTGDCPA